MDSEFKVYGLDEKQERCDYLVKVDGLSILMECNRVYSSKLKDRNLSHLRRLINNQGFGSVMLNFDNYDALGSGKLYSRYTLRSDNDDKFYDRVMQIFHINLSKFNKMVYLKEEIDKLDEMGKALLMFKTRHRENLSMLTERRCWFYEIWTVVWRYDKWQETNRWIYKRRTEIMAFGEKIGKEMTEEIAKNMLKDKVDINTISKYTNLSKKEIEKLK